MKGGLTSVLTCTYNMRESLGRTIRSVLAQRGEWEYWVLDDGSVDGTWEFLSGIKDSRLNLVRWDANRGLTAARNELLRKCRGEFLSIADADDILFPDKIRTHAEVLSSDPLIGMVWGRATVEKNGMSLVVPAFDHTLGWDLVTDYAAVHSATTWRKSAVLEVGGYDPQWTLVEAADLYLRVGDHYRQCFIPRFAAHKGEHRTNPFRSELKRRGADLSRALFQRAVCRRFPQTQSAP